MAVTVNTERKAIEVRWDPGDYEGDVQVFAQGAAGEWHNTAVMPNDGLCAVSYPSDFVGASQVEVRTVNGDVIDVLDSGEIEVS